jgi:hypothetical protein
MQRPKFLREFKVEAVLLIKERGVFVTQDSRDQDVHITVPLNVLRESKALDDKSLARLSAKRKRD